MPKSSKRTNSITDSAGPVRVAAYCRYSGGPGQDEASIEAQHNAVLREARLRGDWQIVWYDEPDRSAFAEDTSKRTRFRELLADAEAGRFDIVVVDKLDRWSRRTRVTLEAWDRLHRAGVGFYSVKERLDFTTPAGWLSANMLATLAEFYSRNLSQEVHKGKLIRAQHGLHAMHAPYGYRVEGTGKDAIAVPDRGEGGSGGGTWDGLQMLLASLARGMSVSETAAALNAAGYGIRRFRNREPRPFIPRTVAAIRSNVFYRPYRPGDTNGTIIWQGEEYRGQHVAACTWDAWHAIQQIAAGRRRGWSKTLTLSEVPFTVEFRGLVACVACGHRLYVHRVHTPPYEPYERYRCLNARGPGDEPCPLYKRWALAEEVRELWIGWLEQHLQLPADWEDAIRELVLSGATEREARPPDELAAARERRRWERRRNAAKALYLDGEIDAGEWQRRRREADEALAALAAAAREPEQHITRLLDAGRMALNLVDYWRVASTQERQQAAALLIEPNGLVVRPLGYRGLYAYNGKGPRPQPRPPSCELVDVRLREPFRELLAALGGMTGASDVG